MRELDLEEYLNGLARLPEVLARMGFKELRPVQIPPVNAVMQGKDLLCFLPTAAGKSAIYSVPTLSMGWKTLVLSPLLSLIRDQCEKLCRIDGIRAGSLSSEQSSGENAYITADWQDGNLDVLLAAPERLAGQKLLSALKENPPDMVVVDEAHVMSQWGANFRPSYVTCGEIVKALNPKVILVLTATCTEEIESDIRRILGLDKAKKYAKFYRRNNLKLSSRPFSSSLDIIRRASENKTGQSIVYCSTVKVVDELLALYGPQISGGAVKYHGQLMENEKAAYFDQFMEGRAKVVFATNAFGLGVDRETVTAVIHHDCPKNLEAYYQEAGRAGRGGDSSDCCLFVSDKALSTQEYFLNIENPPPSCVRAMYQAIASRGGRSSTGCELMISELGQIAGCAPRQDGTALTILMSEGLVERDNSVDLWHKIRVLDVKREGLTKLKGQVLDTIIKIAWPDKLGGYLCFKLEDVAAALNMKPQIVRGHVNDMFKDRYLEYVPAPRAVPLRILKDIKEFDFDRLKARQEQAYNKFDMMLQYTRTPDSEKHEFIEEYFSKVYTSDL